MQFSFIQPWPRLVQRLIFYTKLLFDAFRMLRAANFRSFSSFFSFWRFRFSSAPHKWQKRQAAPFSQPSLWKKAQGLQRPVICSADPTEGNSESSNANGSNGSPGSGATTSTSSGSRSGPGACP